MLRYGDWRIGKRVWARIAPEPMSGCWIWLGSTDNDGYGHMFYGDRVTPRDNQEPGLHGPCDECPECGAAFVGHGGTSYTLVGTFSPEGHEHDRNCMKREYRCAGGHVTALSKVRTCGDDEGPRAEGCAWKGRTSCFCCQRFVDEWPAVQP